MTTARHRYINDFTISTSDVDGTFLRYVASLYIGVSKMKRAKVALILLMGCMMISGLACGKSGEELYNADRVLIRASANSHMSGVPESARIPLQNVEDVFIGGKDVTGPEIQSGAQYYIIAACPLLIEAFPSGILDEVPASCEAQNCADSPPLPNISMADIILGNTGRNTAENLSVSCTGHYRWIMTDGGDIASICIGEECQANDEDGYQGVYP